MKKNIYLMLIAACLCSCSSPHKELVDTVDSILALKIENPDRSESYSVGYEQWLENLLMDCIRAKGIVADVESNKSEIMSFRTTDFCFLPRGYMKSGTDVAVNCAKKAAIGNSLDSYMSQLKQLLITEELQMAIPESERGKRFSADTAYIHSGIRKIIDHVTSVCDYGINQLSR